jgi:hypothetical protein
MCRGARRGAAARRAGRGWLGAAAGVAAARPRAYMGRLCSCAIPSRARSRPLPRAPYPHSTCTPAAPCRPPYSPRPRRRAPRYKRRCCQAAACCCGSRAAPATASTASWPDSGARRAAPAGCCRVSLLLLVCCRLGRGQSSHTPRPVILSAPRLLSLRAPAPRGRLRPAGACAPVLRVPSLSRLQGSWLGAALRHGVPDAHSSPLDRGPRPGPRRPAGRRQ